MARKSRRAEAVVDLGHGPHGTARILIRRLLFDGDDGTETGDLIYIGPFHIADELPGIGAETFHIAALSFRINSVESQGGFTAAADTGDDHQLVLGDADIDVLQIMYPCAGYFDGFFYRLDADLVVIGHMLR